VIIATPAVGAAPAAVLTTMITSLSIPAIELPIAASISDLETSA